MRQINGRIHRQPQDKTVHVIHLLADDTSDVVMFSMAKGKKVMLEAFVTRNPQAESKHNIELPFCRVPSNPYLHRFA
jgi:SNF2 family DNA or RNA helicase